MGVHIYNRTPYYREADHHTYELLINNDLIVTFKHVRSDGLAECLIKAAEAVRRKEDETDKTTNP